MSDLPSASSPHCASWPSITDRYFPQQLADATRGGWALGHSNGLALVGWEGGTDEMAKVDRVVYRQRVLEPGGSKKAAELIEDFLGRPYSFAAFEAWMNRE